MTETPPSAPRRRSVFATHPAELRHATRVAVAVGVAFALGSVLRLPQAYWIVFTAIIVVQTSVGGTITASFERLLGTLVGGLIGVGAAYLRARTTLEEGLVLSIAAAIAAFAAAVRPSLRVAPITAAIVLLGGASTQMSPLTAAAWRVLEIALGGAVGVAVTLVVFPARARLALRRRAAQTMRQLAEVLRLFADGFDGGGVDREARPAYQDMRKSLALADQALVESEHESLTGLRDEAPEGLVRSLRRLYSDSIMIGRALAEPLPAAAGARLGPSAVEVLRLAADRLGALASATETGAVPPSSELASPRQAFEAAVEQARQARTTSGMTFEAVARVFGLVFAVESLLANLNDLADRIGELEGQAAPSAGTATAAEVPAP